MLPNWLLGKSKTKLQEILGGGGGGTSYIAGDGIDISSGVISFDPETTPAIDPSKIDGLDDDLAALAPKTTLSNPNILHNPWFTVNQRGITSLSVGGKIADRWGITGNGTWTVTRTSEGYLDIDNSNNENTLYLIQKRTLTYLTSLQGYPLTASVMFSDGTVVSGTKPTSTGTVYVDTDDIAITRNYQSEILNVNIKPGKHVIIKALKLEVGEISTLHLDPRPEYAIELAKCQRYFIRLGSNTNTATAHLTFGVAITDKQVVFALPLPSQMRTQPTMSASLIKLERYGGTTPTITPTFTITAMADNIIRLNATGPDNTYTTGAVYALVLNYTSGSPAGYIDFSADL